MDALFVMNKTSGVSSSGFLNRFKKCTGFKKCGYAGTLDPFATGVLVIGCGKDTKLLSRISEMDKEYDAIVEFGFETDSGDVDGVCLDRCEKVPDIKEIRSIISQSFTGEILQIPPVYSALKCDGARLCDLARTSKKSMDELIKIAEDKIRAVHILTFSVDQIDLRRFRFKITCSKGTYIRKLVVDLARLSGSLATVIELERTKVGPFSIKDAVDLEILGSLDAKDFAADKKLLGL